MEKETKSNPTPYILGWIGVAMVVLIIYFGMDYTWIIVSFVIFGLILLYRKQIENWAENEGKNIVQLIFGLITVVGIMIGGYYGYYTVINKPPTEVNGIVKYDDCREKVILTTDEYAKQGGTFICNLLKTNSGKSLGGECVKIITDSSGGCQTVYLYQKPSEITCGDNSYPNANDMCTCNYGYTSNGSSCISYDQDCVSSYGTGSYSTNQNQSGKNSCGCSSGYVWNPDNTACMPKSQANQGCITAYGEGSYFTTENGKGVCDCSVGYTWNSQQSSCVTTESINQLCKQYQGENSYYLGYVTNGKYNCK
ncbi:MAG: hypothetical protein NTX96_00800 [Candidatus Zambryskibacteria bacterium]|nr:hypothetical protein [Candidatus Zambryskibacteria bacterium]